MEDEKKMKQAQATYQTLCKMLDTRDWKYQKNDEKLKIESGIRGEDLPIEFIMVVNPRQEIVSFFSRLPFKMSEEKRVEGALAVCLANYGMADGSFDYDISDGEIVFRMTSSFRESLLGEDLFEYMIMCAASTVDVYNDKFLMVSKGAMSIEQFIEFEKSRRS